MKKSKYDEITYDNRSVRRYVILSFAVIMKQYVKNLYYIISQILPKKICMTQMINNSKLMYCWWYKKGGFELFCWFNPLVCLFSVWSVVSSVCQFGLWCQFILLWIFSKFEFLTGGTKNLNFCERSLWKMHCRNHLFLHDSWPTNDNWTWHDQDNNSITMMATTTTSLRQLLLHDNKVLFCCSADKPSSVIHRVMGHPEVVWKSFSF